MLPLSLDLAVVWLHERTAAVDADEFSRLAELTLGASGATGQWSVAIVLTSDVHLRQLHRDFMGIDEETDVMTFPSGSDGNEDENQGGDVVISVDRAAEQCGDAGLTLEEEIRFLAVHGLLHLAGWEDDTPDRRSRMLARQSELIAAFAGSDR
jgi:probable rRNA maturation factor